MSSEPAETKRNYDGGILRISDIIRQIMEGQQFWSSRNTQEMSTRGLLVRRSLPDGLLKSEERLKLALTPFGDDLRIEGRDGTGLKSEIPWVRIFSHHQSKSATDGWYVVYLFDALGENCFLTLMHGTTSWTRGEFKPIPKEELSTLVSWAHSSLNMRGNRRPETETSIQLLARSSTLGRAYESGTVQAIKYPYASIPNDGQLLQDLYFMLENLSIIYSADGKETISPSEPSPEIDEAINSANIAAGKPPAKRSGQGQRQSAAERRAIELHAVDLASRHLESLGFKLNYVGDNSAFDIEATGPQGMIYVEVKGTTSQGTQVILTANEVKLHRKQYPKNCLIVVSGIGLGAGTLGEPVATGGSLMHHEPWLIQEESLKTISYQYQVPELQWRDR